MLIRDHINLTGKNPLADPHEDFFGAMSRVYDPALGRRAAGIAAQEKIRLHAGVYAGLLEPSLETPAETRFLKIIGADAVGGSTVPQRCIKFYK